MQISFDVVIIMFNSSYNSRPHSDVSSGSGCAWFPDVLESPALVRLDPRFRGVSCLSGNKCLAYSKLHREKSTKKYIKNMADDQLGIERSKYIYLVLHMNHSINEHL